MKPKEQRVASSMILALFASFILLVGFGGCQETRSTDPVQIEKDKKVAQVSANLKPIGQHLENTGRSLEGGAVKTQASVLDAVVQVDPKDIPAPVVSYEEWSRTKEDAAEARRVAAKYQADAARAKSELEEIRAANNGWWSWLRDGSAIAGLLAAAGSVYRGLNGPGSQFIDMGLKLIYPKGFQALEGNVEKLVTKNATLVTAVSASDVGREALGHLDERIGKLPPEARDALAGLLSAASGGKASTLQDFFKVYAKAHAVDEGVGGEINSLLDEIRNTRDTSGGKSDAFLHILKAMAENQPYA